MTPWVGWLDYFGADGLGRLTGLWLKFCLSLPRRLVRLLARVGRTNHRFDQPALQREERNQPSPRKGLPLGKLGKIIVSSSLTLLVWIITTWKPIWTDAGADGERILAAILLVVSASWVISLVWICFSKSRRSEVAVLGGSSADARSRTAKAS